LRSSLNASTSTRPVCTRPPCVPRPIPTRRSSDLTIPLEEAIQKARSGENPVLSTAEKHQRVCYAVPEEGVNLEEIEQAIKTMPHYFEPYQTTVHFISEETLRTEHSSMPHGGMVLRTGKSANG